MVSKILVPIDFSDVTDKVMEMALKYAKAFEYEIVLLHVQQPVSNGASMYNPGMPIVSERYTEANDDVLHYDQKHLDSMQFHYSDDKVKIETILREGDPLPEILLVVNELKPELIIAGSHGHGALYNLLLGSVSEGLLQKCKTPFLVVKP